MLEIWKCIDSLDGLYQASSFGNIRSIDRVVPRGNNYLTLKGKVLKQHLGNHGYLTVSPSLDGRNRRKTVHRLVAEAFCGVSKLTVDHVDGNKLNNRADNLEFVTKRENLIRHHAKSKDSNLPAGVSRSRNRFVARIRIDGHNNYLGHFLTSKDAGEAYELAKLAFDH